MILIIAIAVVLSIIGAVAFFMTRPKSEPKPGPKLIVRLEGNNGEEIFDLLINEEPIVSDQNLSEPFEYDSEEAKVGDIVTIYFKNDIGPRDIYIKELTYNGKGLDLIADNWDQRQQGAINEKGGLFWGGKYRFEIT